MKRPLPRFWCAAGISVFVALAGAEVAVAQIRILPSADVQTPTIYLSSLVPAGASQPVHSAAARITLGAAPQLGTVREISHDVLVSAISAGGLSPSAFAIPASVTVQRGGRPISREEVFAAIQSALAKNGAANFPRLEIGDLRLDMDIRVPAGDAGLEVTQMEFDPFMNRLRFRLWPKRAPGVLPFFVTAETLAAAPRLSPRSGDAFEAVRPVSRQQASTPFLVSAGRPARLHIYSESLDMLLDVSPLQRGHLNEIIRVRLAGSGRVLRARVTGESYLDATL